MSCSQRFVPAALWLAVVSSFASVGRSDELLLHDRTSVRFASQSEAEAFLREPDRFVAALSPFDRQSRLETDREVSEQEFLRFVASHARPWTDEQIAKVQRVVSQLRRKLAPFDLPLPEQVLLIHTSGREEGNAAYCRRNAIILPTAKITEPEENLERLLNHELFHILSSHNPRLRESLYRIIGFQLCPPIELPPSLGPRKITNPDAPEIDCYIRLMLGDEEIAAAPILCSKTDRFDPQQGGPFFKYLQFRLLVLAPQNGHWRAAEKDGEPVLLSPNDSPDYFRQIGKNTTYIIHPDEVLADNFVYLIQGKKDLPTPQIVEQMRQLLRRPPAEKK